MSYGIVNATGWQEHHVIPRQIMKSPRYADAADFVRSAEFGIESGKNKQWLPSGVEGTYNPDGATHHRGSHPVYTDYVGDELGRLQVQANEEKWTSQQRQSAIDHYTAPSIFAA